MRKIIKVLAMWFCKIAGIETLSEGKAAQALLENRILNDVNNVVKAENSGLQKEVDDLEFKWACCDGERESAIKSRDAYKALAAIAVKAIAADDFNDYKNVYGILKNAEDPYGLQLYREAKKLLGAKEVWHYFPIEDSLGYFEGDDATVELYWLEIAFFGEPTYSVIQPGVERIDEVSFDRNQERLDAFRKQLYKNIVERMLFEEPAHKVCA